MMVIDELDLAYNRLSWTWAGCVWERLEKLRSLIAGTPYRPVRQESTLKHGMRL